jgi:hypothetical protein
MHRFRSWTLDPPEWRTQRNRLLSLDGMSAPSQALFNPVISLDFTTGTLDPMFTFTRASSATLTNSSGLVEAVGNNIPRFDYDPVTNECLGLLIEEQSTNLLTYSENFGNWLDFDIDYSNSTTSPSGGSASILENLNTGGEGALEYDDFFSTNKTRTFSFWAKRISGTGYFKASVKPTQGEPITIPVTSSWKRYSVTSTGTAQPSFILETYEDKVAVWGVQLEEKSHMTSYIPTPLSSAVTRLADFCVAIDDQVLSWYNSTSGTFIVSGQKSFAQDKFILGGYEEDYLNELSLSIGAFSRSVLYKDPYFEELGLVISDSTVLTKVGFSFDTSSHNFVINNQSTSTPSGVVPDITRLSLGSFDDITPTRYNGHIKSLEYYADKMSINDLLSFTT